ncbi:MAG TPA: UDP-N-acetylmuramoyl-L-alanine--D-glutamate ligase [Acidimicrobiales bacterium]|nr:UDP-N-acetylmuramoyl-L-alanine--D-glutamate ligase [Acidimicrobiales bacterium]
MRAVVVGLAVTGRAVARALLARGWDVVAVDDRPGPDARGAAEELGITLVESPPPERLVGVTAGAEVVVVSPGVPAAHPVFSLPPGPEVVSEIELAARWATVPMVAVTGTNGKTTVVTLAARMLAESGVKAVAAGNIGLPLIEAVDSLPAGEGVLVVEVSSFQLALTTTFHPAVATWLNLAEDHLDWHPSLEHYAGAKARIWRNQGPEDTAVVNAEDETVMRAATSGSSAPGSRLVTFGLAGGDYTFCEGNLVGPGGTAIAAAAELPRALPHDVSNYLAAVASAVPVGATLPGCRRALLDFEGLPHRVALVRESGGVRFYDDSKATTPASVLAALSGFDSVVLIAGGRNKGLDLGVLRDGAPRIRAVVAIGEAAGEVADVFAGTRPVRHAASMQQAVELAAAVARPGDAVLLSPGCASFDWYGSYAERGDDFVAAVGRLTGPGSRA